VGAEGRHLKLAIVDNGIIWDGIAFRQGEWVGKLPDRVDIVYRIEVNEWNGRKRLQLNIRDIQPAAPGRELVGGLVAEDETQVGEGFGT
jgi:single-stranded-DNA-specific exonuclease